MNQGNKESEKSNIATNYIVAKNMSIRSVYRFIALALAYGSGLSVCFWLAWQMRFDFVIPEEFKSLFPLAIAWVIPMKLLAIAAFRQFSGMLSFFGIRDLFRLFGAMVISSVILLSLRLLFDEQILFSTPRGVIFIDFVFSFLGLSGIRLLLRIYTEKSSTFFSSEGRAGVIRVAIIGAGHIGGSLARELFTRRSIGMLPVYFFDDDHSKWRGRVHDIPVLGKPELLLESRINEVIDQVVIALPTGSSKRIKEVVQIAQSAELKCETVPSLGELATGRVKVSQLRNVQIQDLLGRQQVKLETQDISKLISNKIVMVTGAGGSIGGELCRQIATFNPTKILLLERCEVQLFKIESELIQYGFGASIITLVADILDIHRLRSIFSNYNPQLVFHAAAHKHVPMMEHQASEAFKNNSKGTADLAELAVEFKVDLFLLISSDKAINPTNVMGASKRLAEIYLQSLANKNNKTKFVAVRFGNVLGSSGSVIPIFEQQIESGGSVKVTHPDVTRYFMTIPEAVGLVLQAATQTDGGEIFVLDMGEPIKIVDLAKQLILLHGRTPDEDIKIEFIGLRPGEKLFEELSHKNENLVKTNHPKIFRFVSNPKDYKTVRTIFEELNNQIYETDSNEFKQLIKKNLTEYTPYIEIKN